MVITIGRPKTFLSNISEYLLLTYFKVTQTSIRINLGLMLTFRPQQNYFLKKSIIE